MADDGDLIPIVLCFDCTAAHANGIDAADDHVEVLGDLPAGYTLTLGSIHDAEQLAEDRLWQECIHDTSDFSSRACGGCGTTLAGYRNKAVLWPPSTVIH